MHLRLRTLGFLTLAAAILLTAGCGKGNKDKVVGTVLLGDSPVSGAVVFKGESKEYEGPINPKGEYTLINLPKGSYKVYIKGGLVSSAPPPPGAAPLPGVDQSKQAVSAPKIYTDPATSGLTFDYDGGTKDFNIALKGTPGQ